MKDHLSDRNIYTEVENNPTNAIRMHVNKKLMELKKKKLISDEQYKILYVNSSITPLFYALIKTHKEGFPIRPIVSFIDSPTY